MFMTRWIKEAGMFKRANLLKIGMVSRNKGCLEIKDVLKLYAEQEVPVFKSH